MGVTRNVKSGWESFHSNIQLPRSVQNWEVAKEVQHAMKNMILESNGKDRTLKEEEEGC